MQIEQNTSLISTYGVGTIKIQPNIIRIAINFSNVSKTINEAQIEVNRMVKILLNIFAELGIDNYHTNTVNFHPEYERKDHKNILVGQKVEQGIIIIIKDLKNNIQKAKDLLDEITLKVETMSCIVHFGIDDYEDKLTEARNLAYNNAFEKAQKYAKQANLKIIKTVKISEFEPRDDINYNSREYIMCTGSPLNSTELPLGEIDIETKLYCDFLAQ